MREIYTKPALSKSPTTVRITLLVNPQLWTKLKNVLQAQWTQGNFTQKSISDTIRHLLGQYQQKPRQLTPFVGPCNQEISVRLPLSLYEFYKSLEPGKRTSILNALLQSYLQEGLV